MNVNHRPYTNRQYMVVVPASTHESVDQGNTPRACAQELCDCTIITTMRLINTHTEYY